MVANEAKPDNRLEGDFPPGWTMATLGDLVADTISQAGPEPDSDFVYVDISSVNNKTKRIEEPKQLAATEAPSRARQRLQAHDVLVSMTRPNLNAVALVPAELNGAIGSTGFCVLRAIEVDPHFIYYRVQSQAFVEQMVALIQGVLYPAVRPKDILGHQLPLPPLPEQRRIVAAIETQFTRLDAGVAALKALQAKLKRYRAAVLKAAVEGRLTEEWRAAHPDVEPAEVLLQRILQERRQAWEQAELEKYAGAGKAPPRGWQAKYSEPTPPDIASMPALTTGWCWATIGQLVARSEYGTSVKCRYDASGLPVLRIPNIVAGVVDVSDLKFATEPLHLTSGDALQQGDLLMCRTNGSVSLIGKTALIQKPFDQVHTFASYLLRFRFVLPDTLPRWVHLYAMSPQGRRFIERNAASSAGQHNVSLTLIHSMPVPLPTIAEQEQIVAEVDRRLSVVSEIEPQVEVQLKRSERLRQSILSRAFAGKLVPQDPNDEPAEALLARIRCTSSGARPQAPSSGPRGQEQSRDDGKKREARQLRLI